MPPFREETVRYDGYVYVRGGESQRVPGLSEVRTASELLKRPKKARNTHPLFARGFETDLIMQVRDDGLLVKVPTKDGRYLVVMDHPLHKVAFVVDMGKNMFFVAKHTLRNKEVMFKCHGFTLKGPKEAQDLAKHITRTANNVFQVLRKTRLFVQQKGTASLVIDEPRGARGVIPSIAPQSAEETQELKKIVKAAHKDRELKPEEAIDVLDMLLDEALQEESIDLQDPKVLQQELRKALLDADDEEGKLPGGSREDEYIWFDDYSDEFARMSMMLYHDIEGEDQYMAVAPEYADVTLDSEYFEIHPALDNGDFAIPTEEALI